MTRTGYVVFRLGPRRFATSLDDVREIVRLQPLEPLLGAIPPLAGVMELRGTPLPVMDVRAADALPDEGDVLVMTLDGDTVGVAVDAVEAVLHPDELGAASKPAKVLPAYVIGVCPGPTGPLLLVDLRRLLDLADWGPTAAIVSSERAPAQT
ncbi:MAG TPA: chemotaxis protein CheW [Mycobacteriales bacterium]|jgi:purine-binding chemotaxis protein CheW|nr:chemotaxis protein CheW [Mycobacteriales bacterium]